MKPGQWRLLCRISIALGVCTLTGTIFAASTPIANTCSTNPDVVYAGDPVTVTCSAIHLNPKKNPAYSWSSTSGQIGGTLATATVSTTGLSPGIYTVTEHIAEGKKPTQSADGNATFTVRPFDAPTLTCSADPTSLQPGELATITAHGVSPQHRPLGFSFVASSGRITGTANQATLHTAGVAPGIVTVSCNVIDDQGHKTSSIASVTIQSPPPPPTPKTMALCVISFDSDPLHPARVNTDANADAQDCLNIVAMNLHRNADAQAVLVGSYAPREKNGAALAAQRAVNVQHVLVSQRAIDSSRIDMRTGGAGSRSVQCYLVPLGASFDADHPGNTEVNMQMLQRVTPHAARVPAKPTTTP